MGNSVGKLAFDSRTRLDRRFDRSAMRLHPVPVIEQLLGTARFAQLEETQPFVHAQRRLGDRSHNIIDRHPCMVEDATRI